MKGLKLIEKVTFVAATILTVLALTLFSIREGLRQTLSAGILN